MLANGAIDNGIGGRQHNFWSQQQYRNEPLRFHICTNIGVLIDDVVTKFMHCSQVMLVLASYPGPSPSIKGPGYEVMPVHT